MAIHVTKQVAVIINIHLVAYLLGTPLKTNTIH